jgi:predicted RND superfamily exporter protein
VLALADFKGFSEFGIIAGGGILICYAVITLLMPPLIKSTERWGRQIPIRPEWYKQKFFFLKYPRLTVLGFIGASIVAFVLAFNVQWEYDFSKLERVDPESTRLREFYMSVLNLSLSPAVIVSENLDDTKKVLENCKAVQKRNGEKTTIKQCLALPSFIPEQVEKKRPLIARLKELFPEDRLNRLSDMSRGQALRLLKMTDIPPADESSLPDRILDNFTGKDKNKSYLTLIYPSVELRDGQAAIRFADEVFSVERNKADLGPSGQALILADLLKIMQRDAYLVTALSTLLILMLIYLDFRRVRAVGMVFSPLGMTLILLFGFMALADIRIGFFNMVVIPSLIGMGQDNAIHFAHRVEMEGRENIPTIVAGTGRAIMLSILTNAFGYLGLLNATHRGLYTIGELALLGMAFCLITMLVYLPCLLLTASLTKNKED